MLARAHGDNRLMVKPVGLVPHKLPRSEEPHHCGGAHEPISGIRYFFDARRAFKKPLRRSVLAGQERSESRYHPLHAHLWLQDQRLRKAIHALLIIAHPGFHGHDQTGGVEIVGQRQIGLQHDSLFSRRQALLDLAHPAVDVAEPRIRFAQFGV